MKLKNKNIIKVYETDASQIKGKAAGIIHPKTIAEVKNAVILNQKITPRGAGTGLCGGCVPLNGQDVVLDLSKLNHITNLDKQRKTIEVGAGVILDELQIYLESYGLEFPVNPSSYEVCTIGGMIATDAVGSRAGKYGRTSKWVNWIEIIDSKGELQKKGTTELSDYAGMEGTTGIIVRANLKLIDKKLKTASIIPIETIQELVEFVRELKRDSRISMIEFLDKIISKDLELEDKYHLIVEFESNDGNLKGESYEKIMSLRNKIYPLLAEKGYMRIEDPKLLLDRIDKFIPWLESHNIPVFGHLSVGILHPCFKNTKESNEKLIPEMMKIVKRLHGQISGEHGIGILKKQFIDPNDRKILVNIKKRCDKENKFNAGKVI